MILKKFALLSAFAILSITLAHAQAGWVDYKIDKRLSVKMPSQPNEAQGGAIMSMDADSAIYIVVVIDYVKVAQIDSAKLAAFAPTVEFANGIKTGMLGQLPGFTLGEVKIDKWNGNYCYKVDGGNPEKKLDIYLDAVIMGSQMYGLMTITHQGKSTKNKDDFFASLKLN